MHPAPSVILFTTTAGAGYGLLFLLGLAAPLGALPTERWFGLTLLGAALGLVTLGLLASTFHLGHPERAWRAISQWRSSWLSREGVAALLTYPPALAFTLGWVVEQETGGPWALAGGLAALGAAATVFSTGMIYASLKPIRQWHDPLVTPGYIAFSLLTGALWLNVLLRVFGVPAAWCDALVLVALPLAWGLKLLYWRRIGRTAGASTAESATGLGRLGGVRLLDPPHSEENYLLREMGYRVARKHARRLRRLAVVFGLGAPFALAALAAGLPPWPGGFFAMLLAAVSASLGVVVERWLFFAEATHTVTLYYGARTA